MADPRDFLIHVEDDRIRVRFVPLRAMGRDAEGHPTGGDYKDLTIRLFRNELRPALRGVLLHELAHYLVERQELRASDTTEEEICDLFTWLPTILHDPRNTRLRAFLGVKGVAT